MGEDPENRQSMRTASWVWQLLGVAMATATVVSLVKSGFSIDLAAVPAQMYRTYIWLRDSLWAPIS
jgi:hypothetical protein